MAATTHQPIHGETVAIDPAAGPWTIQTPAILVHGAWFAVKTTGNDSAVIIFEPTGGTSIENLHTGDSEVTFADMSINGGNVRWEYDAAVSTWRIIDAYVSRVLSDAFTWDDVNGWLPILATQQLLVTSGPAGLTAKVTATLRFTTQMTASIVLAGVNADVEFDWLPTISDGMEFSFPVFVPFAHSKAGTFLDTRSGVYLWEAAAPGDVWDLTTNDTGGTGTSSRNQIILSVTLG